MIKSFFFFSTRTRLQRHAGLACLEIRSRNEVAINSTRNLIYSLMVFYFLLYRRRYFLFVSELIQCVRVYKYTKIQGPRFQRNQIIARYRTRTLLVALSLGYSEMSFVVKGAGAVIQLFRLEYKTCVACLNVNTQKVKIARRDRSHILASNRCETFENLLHTDIAPLRSTLSGILHSKN